jgi:integrase
MGRRAAGLTAAEVRTKGLGRYGDGDGLYLFVRSKEAAFWTFRYVRAGKMREMGLGRARGKNAVTLAAARDQAGELFRKVRAGVDPLAEREAEAVAEKAQEQHKAILAVTFREAADAYIASHEAAWANPKHRAQWGSTLDAYVHPHFGDVPVGEVAVSHVLAAIEPIWRTKPETAARVRGRIEAVLTAATVRGQRAGQNPAQWKGHLAELLPPRATVGTKEHHAALPWAEVGAFIADLRAQRGVGARALEFAILTAARTGEALGARWSEIDMDAKAWTVPAVRMKAGKEHRVPLSAPAMALLRQMAEAREDHDPKAFVFPGAGVKAPLSIMAMTMVLRRMKRADITVHGFRSTFRDWTADQTTVQREVAEAALAHTLGDKVEAAYRRGDLFDKRTKLMEAWGGFCGRVRASGSVVQMRRAEGGTSEAVA